MYADEVLGALELVGARATAFPLSGPDGFSKRNDEVLELAGAHPERIVPFARLDPHDDALAEATRCVAAGAKGLKLDPRSQDFDIDDRRLDDLFAFAAERRLPHAGRRARRRLRLVGPAGSGHGCAMARHRIDLGPAPDRPAASDGVTWVGNATVLLELAGLRVLTDPNFLHCGDHAKLGGGLRSRRLHEPAFELAELLPVDLVVLSHHHGDHWDEVVDRELPKDVPVVTTAHAAKKLRRAGFRRTYELDSWEEADVRRDGTSLRITALPGVHAPAPLSSVLPPVMGSMLEVSAAGGVQVQIYVSGDTLLHDALRQIPERFPHIDLALVHLGGTRVLGILLTMDGEQGASALEIIDPDAAVPIHYEEYTVMKSPLADFDRAVARRRLRAQVHHLDRGGRLPLPLPVRGG